MNKAAGILCGLTEHDSTIAFNDYFNGTDQDNQTGVLPNTVKLLYNTWTKLAKPGSGEAKVRPIVFEEPDERIREFNQILGSQAIEQNRHSALRRIAREIFEGLDKTNFRVENLGAPQVGGVCFFVSKNEREAYFEVRQSPLQADVIQGVLFLTDYLDESKDRLIKTTHNGVDIVRMVEEAISFLS
ncbi:MAG: hypothetical protein V3V10_05480 [Planctomycetota bacterium]